MHRALTAGILLLAAGAVHAAGLTITEFRLLEQLVVPAGVDETP